MEEMDDRIMKPEKKTNRRRFLKGMSAIGTASAIAFSGCLGGTSGSGTGGGADNGTAENGSNNTRSSGGNNSTREEFGLPELNYDVGGTLNVFQWTDYWPSSAMNAFQNAYGVNVNVSNFSSNPEMFNKLQAGGSGQFDVVFPTQNMYNILVGQDLIQELDIDKISTWENLGDRWKDSPSYEPDSGRYSVPYQWGTSGIAWNTNMIGDLGDSISWEIMWDNQYDNQMTMMNAARETLGAALIKQGDSLNAKEESKIESAKQELINQKDLLKTYSSTNNSAALQNENASPIHIWNGDAMKAYNALAENGSAPIKYKIPEEGGLRWLDTMAITKDAANVNAAHALATFLLNAQIGANIAQYNGYATPNQAAREHLPDSRSKNPIINPPDSVIDRLVYANRFANSPDVASYYSDTWTEVQNA